MIEPIENTITVSQNRRLQEHQIEIEDIEVQNQLKSCCGGTTDRRLLDYISRFFMSAMVLGFAFIQLARDDNDSGMIAFYSSLITFVLGHWLGARDGSEKGTRDQKKK